MSYSFTDFLRKYRMRVDEEASEPTNGVGASVATPEVPQGQTFTRSMGSNKKPHYKVEDSVYRDIRHGRAKGGRWDQFIPQDSELCKAMRGCLTKHGEVSVENSKTGQVAWIKKYK